VNRYHRKETALESNIKLQEIKEKQSETRVFARRT